MADEQATTRSDGQAGADNLIVKVITPAIEALRGIDTAALDPEEVFGKYVDVYLALHAAGELGRLFFATITSDMSPAEREEAFKVTTDVVDEQMAAYAHSIGIR